VGCGRYKGGHAKDHWKESAHCYALEIQTQHVWDYAGDLWVHRLIKDKGDGKIMDLPSSSSHEHGDDMELVPRGKLDGLGMDYTRALTKHLDSQRIYYEDVSPQIFGRAVET
jgi:BRCA1-associated protein